MLYGWKDSPVEELIICTVYHNMLFLFMYYNYAISFEKKFYETTTLAIIN